MRCNGQLPVKFLSTTRNFVLTATNCCMYGHLITAARCDRLTAPGMVRETAAGAQIGRGQMFTYECDWTVGDIAIYAAGAVVGHMDDVDVRLVLDGDCELVAVKLTKDTITGRTAEIAPRSGFPKFSDTNAEEIWRSAERSVAESKDILRERASIPAPRYEAPEYSGREYVPAGTGIILHF